MGHKTPGPNPAGFPQNSQYEDRLRDGRLTAARVVITGKLERSSCRPRAPTIWRYADNKARTAFFSIAGRLST